MSKQQNDSDFESVDSDQSLSITEQIQNSIRQIQDLSQKVQLIAINHYISQKRQLEGQQEKEIRIIEGKTRNLCNVHIEEMYGLIEDPVVVDLAQLEEFKGLIKDEEWGLIENMAKNGEQVPAATGYWLKAMQNSDIIAEQIHESDKPLLQQIYRIQGVRNPETQQLSITFFFKQNKWFHNEKVSKTITTTKNDSPIKSKGDQIEWKDEMNYTVTVIPGKKKKGKKSKDQVIKQPSFFHFFDSIDTDQANKKIKDQELLEDMIDDLELQYELCQHLYEDLIPKSLEYYLGCTTVDQLDTCVPTQNSKLAVCQPCGNGNCEAGACQNNKQAQEEEEEEEEEETKKQ